MKKMLKNRNVLIILTLVVIILAVLIAGKLVKPAPDTLPDLPAPTESAADQPENTSVPASEMPLGYVLATASGETKWSPLPTTDDDLIITITREDDPAISNTLRLTRNGFVMDSSTCDNQDCVMQGEVTLENKSDRVLMHMVICLPHNVSAELYSMEELALMLAQTEE